jgi:hypothetical protein
MTVRHFVLGQINLAAGHLWHRARTNIVFAACDHSSIVLCSSADMNLSLSYSAMCDTGG